MNPVCGAVQPAGQIGEFRCHLPWDHEGAHQCGLYYWCACGCWDPSYDDDEEEASCC